MPQTLEYEGDQLLLLPPDQEPALREQHDLAKVVDLVCLGLEQIDAEIEKILPLADFPLLTETMRTAIAPVVRRRAGLLAALADKIQAPVETAPETAPEAP